MEKDLLYFIYLMLAISTIIIGSYFSYTTTKKDYQKGKENLIKAFIPSPFVFIMFITDGELSLNEIFLSFFIVPSIYLLFPDNDWNLFILLLSVLFKDISSSV
jgi:hypothetical protein